MESSPPRFGLKRRAVLAAPLVLLPGLVRAMDLSRANRLLVRSYEPCAGCAFGTVFAFAVTPSTTPGTEKTPNGRFIHVPPARFAALTQLITHNNKAYPDDSLLFAATISPPAIASFLNGTTPVASYALEGNLYDQIESLAFQPPVYPTPSPLLSVADRICLQRIVNFYYFGAGNLPLVRIEGQGDALNIWQGGPSDVPNILEAMLHPRLIVSSGLFDQLAALLTPNKSLVSAVELERWLDGRGIGADSQTYPDILRDIGPSLPLTATFGQGDKILGYSIITVKQRDQALQFLQVRASKIKGYYA
jgi:hypothetical protein